MLLHQYDSQTGQYLNSFLADPDPLNPGRWLEPAFTTSMQLPERPRLTWPVFRDGSWSLVPDYRTLRLYRKDNGEVAEILVIGITPDDAGLTDVPRPSDEHVWSEATKSWEVDPSIVAARARDVAMAEFERRRAIAVRKNFGKADAFAAGMMTLAEEAVFKAWAAYQMALVRLVDSPTFPDGVVWPDEPDEAQVVAQAEAEADAARKRLEADAAARLAAAQPPKQVPVDSRNAELTD
ncbi:MULTISPECIES: tail fiber assembly protein [Burkholderia]|uniref:tail fiber assembly protein n=1 Tax=Burkholderia TaxID=32008 RepID=UPI0005D91695|nr:MULTISPECIES: tail fiber assembly protein [Burkholderia]AJY19141.1 caudovirales tail fiber assembly family protein [Burkholderia multivorans ATCC BAA-247]MCO1436264.1 tail fiber assembly protein [Burkholderia multivorans]MDN7508917.1 tail fiber assembly protein [Burkholderia multivorans]MDN7745888.1 tail fiber assembly protein [Burkholderia multivorans]UQN61398.1 tail fiber assembly protein [Burkholderia multivorans]